ncbi:MAG TPA: GIY-YIG nuclease family protein, partial [Pyrinomonadaceae bacterium]|nr:GIY-YIG nuclease family protein [Pyrinomonadaceae bacterium]
LKKEYKQTLPPMGVFLIRNVLNNKILVAAGVNLEGTINRHKFQLARGNHPNTRLQADWDEVGGNNFAFEVVDQLTPGGDPNADRSDLESLSNLWLEKLQPFNDKGYNERAMSLAEKLLRISAKRSAE